MNLKKLTAFASAAAMSLAMLHSYPAQTFEIDWNFAANAADGVAINAENFPDEIFRSYVSDNFDTNSDGALSTEEIADVTYIGVTDSSLSSLEGIEYFTALGYLVCSNNQLTTLDVSENTALVGLYCDNNQLTTLDVCKNTALEALSCSGNQLTTLDVSKNTALVGLYCDNNQLTTLDVCKNTALVTLYCYNNQLTTLDVSNNITLCNLSCGGNQLVTLDVSANAELALLHCYNNQLTMLDLSNNSKLNDLNCFRNQLDVLDLSNNIALEWLDCSHNQLRCLDMHNNTELYFFDCFENQLIALDVGSCTALQYLNCYGNQLTTLDISNNFQLVELNCSYNQIKALDTSNNIMLKELHCHYNQLTIIDTRNNTELKELSLSNNQLTNIDISNNTYYIYSAFDFQDNVYDIGAVDEVYYLNLLPGNFDVTKASSWQGATYENGVLTDFVGISGENKVTYNYNVGQDRVVKFTLTYTLAEEVSGIIGTGLSADVSLEDNMYIADDNSPVISFTASVDYRGNEYFLDVSDYITVSSNTDIDPTLDMTATGTGDESVSAFDLYWSAYNAGTPTTEFTCEYIFDMSRIDELFCELTAISGLSMNYQDNADYFECILYEDGEAILIGDEPYTCKVAQRGDANLDNAVDTRDAASMAKFCSLVANGAENPELSATDNELAQFSGDVNCDGVIDTKDAAIAAKYASLYAVYESDNIASIYYNIYAEMGIIE